MRLHRWLVLPLLLACTGCTKSAATTGPVSATSQPTSPAGSTDAGDAAPSASSATETPTMSSESVDTPEGRYRAWLASEKGMAEAEVAPWRPGMTGDWHFFFVKGPPGMKLHAAAVGPAAILTPKSTDAAWSALLTAGEPAEVHRQIAWLNGMWMAVVPDTPHAQSVARKHPSITDHLAAPAVESTGDTTVFTGWYAEPPAMFSFRYTVTAGPDGATFERKKLADF